ncbi:MAG: HEAT repeat domain-containing protein [Actinomycetota bacterium]|nr:HEAT repeat domain-containing protein [Actinomycetota bacterium]
MRLRLFIISWVLVGLMMLLYVLWGVAADLVTRIVDRRRQHVLRVLSIVLFESDDDAEKVHDQVIGLPKGTLLGVLQTLAVDLDGSARQRLRQLVRTTGLERFIIRRSRSRNWRMRVQAAQLQHLVLHPDFDRVRLLTDKHHLVRARTAESLTLEQTPDCIDELMTMLSDMSPAARFAAQQSLLKAGPICVPKLLLHLESSDNDDVLQALEVAANLADPRLISVLDTHARSTDSKIREMAAKALGNGAGDDAIQLLHRLVGDGDAAVRSRAIESLARMESVTSASLIGCHLSDQVFHVRRAAGLALEQLGPAGRLTLRRHLDDPDRYARDMARQVLDAAAARTGISVIAPLDNPLAGLDEIDGYASIPEGAGRW